MALLENQLVIKTSKIPGAGKGLFTNKFIPKGTLIVEYKGRMRTWKEVLNGKHFNAYVYYIDRNHVIDAMRQKKSMGRYANDAEGMIKINGLKNNSRYVIEGNRVYIESKKDIAAGEEILVSYGKDYWNVIENNHKIDLEQAKKAKAEA